MKYLDKIYKESEVSWFTPVEIFKVISLSLSLLSALRNLNSNFHWEFIVQRLHLRHKIKT